MSAFLLAIASIFFPVVALIGAVTGQGSLALFFFIWWIVWDE